MHGISRLKWLLCAPDSLPFLSNAYVLTAVPAISPSTGVSLSSTEAILARYGRPPHGSNGIVVCFPQEEHVTIVPCDSFRCSPRHRLMALIRRSGSGSVCWAKRQWIIPPFNIFGPPRHSPRPFWIKRREVRLGHRKCAVSSVTSVRNAPSPGIEA